MFKMYKITFITYTNCMCDTVSREVNGETKYLHVGNEGYIARDCDIITLMQYGGGIRTMEFVGYMDEKI